MKSLPWKQLFLVSLITEGLVLITLTFIVLLAPYLLANYISSTVIIAAFFIGSGILSIYLFQWIYPQIPLRKNSRWAMALCLFFSLWLILSFISQRVYPFPSCSFHLCLIMMAVGTFVGSKSPFQGFNFSNKDDVNSKLLRAVNGDRETALRLIKQAQFKYPEKSRKWCQEKVLFDLGRDRRTI